MHVTKTGALSTRWYRLVPMVFITYSLAYLDRANFGFAAAGDMARDLHITPAVSSLAGSLFFLGYFLFQIPGARYAAGRSARKLVFWSLLCWGCLAAVTGVVSNTAALLVIRFLLGVVESAVMPALLILLSRWFTRAERSRANTFLILGNPVTILWMSILSGYLVHAAGWRWMFIWEGLPALVWAVVWWFGALDRPVDARWLPEAERAGLLETLQAEQAHIQPVSSYAEAFRSARVLLLCGIYFLWNFGVYGLVMWLPSIIRAAPRITLIQTGWLSSIPYLLAAAAMLAASYFSDRTLRRKVFIWPCLLVAACAFYGSYLMGEGHFWLSFGLLSLAGMAMYAPYGPFFAIITELLPSNVTGGAIALVNSLGALGSFTGSYLVGYLHGRTGGFGASYLLMAVSLLLAAGAMVMSPSAAGTPKQNPPVKGFTEDIGQEAL